MPSLVQTGCGDMTNHLAGLPTSQTSQRTLLLLPVLSLQTMATGMNWTVLKSTDSSVKEILVRPIFNCMGNTKVLFPYRPPMERLNKAGNFLHVHTRSRLELFGCIHDQTHVSVIIESNIVLVNY